jgi:hypothetical protein
MNELSVKMAEWLSHVRAAKDQGVTLAAYAVSQGLSASSLYQAKSKLMEIGAWPRSSAAPSKSSQPVSRSTFIKAQVLAVPMSCRLFHVSGWRMECDELPSAQWLDALVRGAAHAS